MDLNNEDKAVLSKSSLVLFISTYTMQWLSLGRSYLFSSSRDLLMPEPAAYMLQVIVCKLKVFAVTMRENNCTLVICLVLVFFFFLCVYRHGFKFKLCLDPTHLSVRTALLLMGCSNGNGNGNGNHNGNSNSNSNNSSNSDGKDNGTGNSD